MTAGMTLGGLDDHPVVIEGVAAVLERAGLGLQWWGSAQTFAELQTEIDARGVPDILLVDLHLGDGSRPEDTFAVLSSQGARCVILTSERRPVPIRRAVANGAVGLVLKSDSAQSMVETITQVARGEFAVSSDLAYALATDEATCARLAPREVEVLESLAQGHTRRAVARSFDPPLSESTVATYLERVFLQYRALGRPVNSTVDAIREATADGYVGGDR